MAREKGLTTCSILWPVTAYASEASTQALLRHDRRLSEIIATLKESGLYDNTYMVLLGDHDQMPVHSLVKMNQYFLSKGLIRCNAKGSYYFL